MISNIFDSHGTSGKEKVLIKTVEMDFSVKAKSSNLVYKSSKNAVAVRRVNSQNYCCK